MEIDILRYIITGYYCRGAIIPGISVWCHTHPHELWQENLKHETPTLPFEIRKKYFYF